MAKKISGPISLFISGHLRPVHRFGLLSLGAFCLISEINGQSEILLARSAAPDSISSDATILVSGRQGYETAVRGKPQPQGNLGTDGTFT
jgi:hypothetical protein